MNVELPNEYIVQQIFQLAGYPKIQRGSGVVTAGCPSCREGSSWNVKRRLTYLPQKHFFYCHNCNRNWSPVNFIIEFSGKSFRDVLRESKEYEYVPADLIYKEQTDTPPVEDILPKNAINLFNSVQVDYYKNNYIVQQALDLIGRRRLNTAVNKCDSLYLSLTDFVHKNRLCIPFYNTNNELVFYQTRTILKTDENIPKYLSKAGSDKSVFGIERILEDIDYIFIFEGPIDSMFMKNGVAICGVELTSLQREQLKKFPFHKKIWILDNPWVDKTVHKKLQTLVESNETVFIWPKTDMKDFNEIATKSNINEIPSEFVLKNTMSGLQAKFKLNQFGWN